MADFEIRQGDTNPPFITTLIESDGITPVSLPSGTTVELVLRDANGTVTLDAPLTVADQTVTPGQVSYRWQLADTARAGQFTATLRATYPSGDTQTYPTDSAISVAIVPRWYLDGHPAGYTGGSVAFTYPAAPASLPLTVTPGSLSTLTVTYTDDDQNPVNLTGCTAHLQARAYPGGPVLVDLTDGAGIVLGGQSGTVTVTLTAAQTLAFAGMTTVLYDLQVGPAGADPATLVAGTISVGDAITGQGTAPGRASVYTVTAFGSWWSVDSWIDPYGPVQTTGRALDAECGAYAGLYGAF